MEEVKNNIDIKRLLKLSIPIFLELILQVCLGNVDKIMVNNDNCANAIEQANSILSSLTFSIAVLASGSLILINQYKVNFGFISEKYEISEDGAKTIYELKFTTNLTVVYEGGEEVNIGRVRGLGGEQENDIVSLAVNKENLFLAIRSTREVEVIGKIAQDPDEIDQTSLLFKRSGDNYIVGGNIDLIASEIVIPERFNGKPVTRIVAAAFYDMDNLTTVTIPKSITFISKTAFSGCDKMKIINYCGSQEEWKTVVATSGHNFTGITVNYNCQ